MIDTCAVCHQPCEYIDCPTGGWWAHLKHPADGHDADPWGRTFTLTVVAREGVDLGDTIEAALAELMAADANDEARMPIRHPDAGLDREEFQAAADKARQDANDEARSQLTDDDHDPRDF